MKHLRADRIDNNELAVLLGKFKIETQALKRLNEEARGNFLKSLELTAAIDKQTEVVRSIRKKIPKVFRKIGVSYEAA